MSQTGTVTTGQSATVTLNNSDTVEGVTEYINTKSGIPAGQRVLAVDNRPIATDENTPATFKAPHYKPVQHDGGDPAAALAAENNALRSQLASVSAVVPDFERVRSENELLKEQLAEMQLEMRRMQHRMRQAATPEPAPAAPAAVATPPPAVKHAGSGGHVTDVAALREEAIQTQRSLDKVTGERNQLLTLVNDLNGNYESLEKQRMADMQKIVELEAMLAAKDGELKIAGEWKGEAGRLKQQLSATQNAEKQAKDANTAQLVQMADEQDEIRRLNGVLAAANARIQTLTAQAMELTRQRDMEGQGRLTVLSALQDAEDKIDELKEQRSNLLELIKSLSPNEDLDTYESESESGSGSGYDSYEGSYSDYSEDRRRHSRRRRHRSEPRDVPALPPAGYATLPPGAPIAPAGDQSRHHHRSGGSRRRHHHSRR